MLGNRYSQHSFARVPDVRVPRSTFDRSFTVKDTFDFDYLVPFYVDEILPGDTFNCTVNAFMRLATQKVPIMDNMYVDYFFFFVPNRLVFDKWERLNGYQPSPGDSVDFVTPKLTIPPDTQFEVGSFFDKLGLPTDVTIPTTAKIQTLPMRAYNLIYNDWFRDENLGTRAPMNTGEGPDAMTDYELRKRNRKHDYFTSALPWPQKGDAVEIGLGGTAPLTITGTGNISIPGQNTQIRTAVGGGGSVITVTNAAGAPPTPVQSNQAGAQTHNAWQPAQNITAASVAAQLSGTADLSAATAVTINALREAFMMQSLLELDARGGTRYTEILRAHFGVISPDFRLQRPEFLGHGSSRINVHPVAQTAPTDDTTTPQANLSSFATTSLSGNSVGFTKSFVEHGYVIGLMCARADITYQQGLNRMWSRSTRWDFYWPKFQQLGEQEILQQEIYFGPTQLENDVVFGYQERHGDYRYRPSEIHGAFRSTYATSLDMWHLAEEFSSEPELNGLYIMQNTPIERAIAVTDEPHLLADMWIRLKCARPMIAYPTPATLGRF